MTQSKTHWKKFFDYRFISAEELDGKEVTLTIIDIHKDEVYNRREKAKEVKPALRFKETEKMMILNVTNARKISEVLESPKVEDWIGKRIKLYPVAISAGGENVEAIRIKKADQNAPAAKPEFKAIEYDNAPETKPEPATFNSPDELNLEEDKS